MKQRFAILVHRLAIARVGRETGNVHRIADCSGRGLAPGVHRSGEFAARMGGEEFAMFFPTMKLAAALEVAERVREGVLNLRIPHEKSLTSEFVTVSIGVVSCVPEWELEFDQLLQAADDALYESKTSGRNRITAGDLSAGKESDRTD